MSRNPSVFGWEHEPADERPSEFARSTGYSVLSGYHVPSDLHARAARRSSGGRIGFKTIVAVFLVLLAVSGVAMHEVVKLLH